MHEGQTLRVKAVTGSMVTFDSGLSYGLGPATRGHDAHAPLRVGDVLVVVGDSAPNGDTLAKLPCHCELLLLSV